MAKIKTRNILLIWVVLYILKKKILSFFSIFFNFSIDKTVIFIPFLKLSGSFDSNNRTLITLSGFFSLHFDQMDGTLPIWSHYRNDPIIRDPIKRSLLYYQLVNIQWRKHIRQLSLYYYQSFLAQQSAYWVSHITKPNFDILQTPGFKNGCSSLTLTNLS